MPLMMNNKEIYDVYLGDHAISEIYKGDVLVFSQGQAIDLGSGKNFTINSSIYPDYHNLTSGNFFFLTCNGTSANISCWWAEWAGTNWLGSECGIEKSYNESTGALKFQTYADAECRTVGGDSSGTGSVHAYLIPNPEKLVYLGTSRTLDCSNISGYDKFTVNNFLFSGPVKNIYYGPSSYYGGSSSAGASMSSVTKSYNSANGRFTYSCTVDLYVYLYKKGV